MALPGKEGFGASGVAFSADGKSLLFNGHDGEPAKLWILSTDDITRSQQTGPGPVAFGKNGEPLQLVAHPTKPHMVLLWDVAKGPNAQEFSLEGTEDQHLTAMALAADGALVAASLWSEENKGTTWIWDRATGQRLHRILQPASALAFSPDGNFFALGGTDGDVAVRELAKDKETIVLRGKGLPTRCLAFGRNPLQRSHPWRLAVGDSAGGPGNLGFGSANNRRSLSRISL